MARFAPAIVSTKVMSVQGFIRGLKPMIARDVKMTSTELVSYVEILDKALDTEYMKSSIRKYDAVRKEANKSKIFQESNKRRPNRDKVVALTKGQRSHLLMEITTTTTVAIMIKIVGIIEAIKLSTLAVLNA